MSRGYPVPPPELVQQWWEEAHQHADRDDPQSYYDAIATSAAAWGADRELEACADWVDARGIATSGGNDLRAARRRAIS